MSKYSPTSQYFHTYTLYWVAQWEVIYGQFSLKGMLLAFGAISEDL